MTTKENLQQLLDFFDDEPEKWIQGTYYNEDSTAFCLVGRILRSTDYYDQQAIYKALIKAAELDPVYWPEAALIHWNDSPSRTFPEVKALLEKALNDN